MGALVKDKDTGALRGVAGATIVLSAIQSMVDETKPFGDGHAFVFSAGGIVVAHTDPERLGKDMRESESDTFGPFLNTMIDAVTKGTSASFAYQSDQSNTVMQYYAVPFSIGQVPRPWMLVVGVSRNTIMAPVYRMVVICLILGILIIVLMSAGVILTARSISRPLTRAMAALKDIAEGDLTKEIAVNSKDEVGELARHLNFTVDKIKNLVVSIKKEAQSLSQTGSELAVNIAETAASINGIAANIQSVMSQTATQEASVKGAGASMEQIVAGIDTLNEQIQKQGDCVSQSSAAVEQMLANIQNVTRTLVGNTDNVRSLAEASERGRNGLREVSAAIQEIDKESEGLLEINAVMQNIASQTNLLSMNAAIEAAHAGEAGKGFAVVADEIRKLAESSSEQSKTISGVLKKIKDSIGKITKSANSVLLKFEDISAGMQRVTEQEAKVRAAMEEQGEGSKNILDSISGLNEITGVVTRGSHTMGVKSQDVIKESETLERISGEINGRMQEMATGAEQISTAVNQVNAISEENKERIAALVREASRFKTNEEARERMAALTEEVSRINVK
jgi:methyl-accepting chemotaxis protein